MVTPTSSYLKMLPSNEAIALITSLQKLKDHLSQELQLMTQQVQQKTVQLQGIETLLTEAQTFGLDAKLTSAIAQTSGDSAVSEGVKVETGGDQAELEQAKAEDIPAPNGSGVAVARTPKVTIASPRSISKADSIPSPESSPIAGKTQSKSQIAPTRSTNKTKSKAKAKKKKPTTDTKTATTKAGKDLRELLRPKFAGKSLKDAVAEILEASNKPLHLDELLIEMYGALANEDFRRAKISLTNVLSLGKSKGEWRNVGQGLYAANSLVTS